VKDDRGESFSDHVPYLAAIIREAPRIAV
jgi:hypothetical protein